jgi:hypothetical protein
MGWTIWGTNPKVVCAQKARDWLWDSAILLLFSGYRGYFPGLNRPGRTLSPNLVPRLRMGGAVPLLPLYDFTFFTFDVGQLH